MSVIEFASGQDRKQSARPGADGAVRGAAKNEPAPAGDEATPATGKPSDVQRRYLRLGLDQPGGKLPLFDRDGQEIRQATIRACIEHGWAEPWFENPIKPGWLVCRLTEAGRKIAGA
ncbi:MAG: hypothetical protein KDJ80_08780 [Nitratireductor sp.]|nr:hypothetical protein [Nitratireductor sp.]